MKTKILWHTFIGICLVLFLCPWIRRLYFDGGWRWQYLLFLSFLVTYFLVPFCRRLALRFNILDNPNWRKIHDQPTPLLGGLAVYLGFSVSLLVNDVFLSDMKILLFGATLIFLMGLWDDTYHRIWTGQAELLMPRIDSFRLQICDYLTERFGKSWPTSWIAPITEDEMAAVKENPRACQWGHLSKIFDVAPKLKSLTNLYKAVKFVRVVRNELAHFRPIKNYDFRKLSQLIARCEI